MGIYWKNIDPEMQILGATQQFIFNQNLNQFQFDNTFVPTSLIPSQNLFELRNSGLSGFRFRHETAFGDTHGTLKIQSLVNGQTTGVDLMSFNQDGTITFNAPLILNDLNFTKIGIGIDPTVDGTIQFSNDLIQKKLVLYDTTGNNHQYYGFGIDSGTLRYQSSGGSHLFWIGTSSTTSYCGLSINSSGNIGLGNYQSATLSRLFINGGPTLDAVGEESAIRVQNSDLLSTAIKIQLVHQNAKNWELRSNSNGSFEIYDRFGLTSRFLMQGTGATTLNGSLTINNTGVVLGNLGIGTTTPTLSKLQIVGGVQNIGGEDTAIRVSSALNNVKIELQSTAIAGKLYEIRSSSTGQFDITDRTASVTRYAIDTNGNHIFSNTIYGRRASGTCYMQNNVVAVTTIAGVFQKVAGTTTATATLNNFSMSASNRLQYTGTQQMMALILVGLTYIYNSSILHRIGFSIYKNGALVTPSALYHDNNTSNFDTNVSLHTMVSLSTNDYIEVYCSSSAGGVSLTVTDLTFTVTAS